MNTSRPSVVRIEGVIRHYAWGSPTAIPQMLGLTPTEVPAAELWLGAHPDDPAVVVQEQVGGPGDLGLDALIDSDPSGLLGAPSLKRFGPRLPFLLKLLAADRALSLQVHPNLKQARAAYLAEQHPDFDGPHNYQDDNHKPELLCALSEFSAYCGFRPADKTAAFLEVLLDVADPSGVASPDVIGQLTELGRRLTQPDGVREAFTWLLRLSPDKAAAFAHGVVGVCQQLVDRGPSEWMTAAQASVIAGGDFPGDIGAVVGLLLNFVVLAPGEALFLGAGNVHAYLRGLGVEIMANSDNVLRCGLTPKRIDVDELLRIADFRPLKDPRWLGVKDGSETKFVVPVPDFSLSEIRLDNVGTFSPSGFPRIVLCTQGRAEVRYASAELALSQGQAAFVGADTDVYFCGIGTLFVASVGASVAA